MSERKTVWRDALYGGLAFGLVMGLLVGLLSGWLPPENVDECIALAEAILLSGGLFGLLVGLFAHFVFNSTTEGICIKPSEVLIRIDGANHWDDNLARGGRLALTNTHLVFAPYWISLHSPELRIPLSEIANVETHRTWGIIPNGLTVKLKRGALEKFIVHNNSTWTHVLSKKI